MGVWPEGFPSAGPAGQGRGRVPADCALVVLGVVFMRPAIGAAGRGWLRPSRAPDAPSAIRCARRPEARGCPRRRRRRPRAPRRAAARAPSIRRRTRSACPVIDRRASHKYASTSNRIWGMSRTQRARDAHRRTVDPGDRRYRQRAPHRDARRRPRSACGRRGRIGPLHRRVPNQSHAVARRADALADRVRRAGGAAAPQCVCNGPSKRIISTRSAPSTCASWPGGISKKSPRRMRVTCPVSTIRTASVPAMQ